jgi:DHA2 family multidrug resistance protein
MNASANVAGSAAGAEPRIGPFQHRLITVAVMLATIMQALDTTIANVALPHMQGSLSATQDQMAWVLTSYIVAAAIMTPLTGWLAPRFGRKRVFLISIVCFTIASALCGLAENLTQIVLFRLLQGVAGAALVPMSQAILLDINPREKTAQAMSVWGTAVTLAPILGPIIGGWLTDNYSWRWVFLINVPIGIIGFVMLFASLPSTTARRGHYFDFLGFGALSLAVGAFQLMLDRGELKGWFESSEIMIEATIAALGFYTFLIHSMTSDRPFVSLALFKDRNFVAGTINICILSGILASTLALMPPMLQNLMGYPVTTTGLVTGPRGLGVLAAVFLYGRIATKVEPRLLVIAGMALTPVPLWEMAHFTLEMGWGPLVWWAIVQGFAFGIVFIILMSLSFTTLPTQLRSEATAISSLARNLGQSIGISISQAMLTSNTQKVHATLAEHIRPDNPLLGFLRSPAIDITTPQGLTALNGMVTRQASMVSYLDDFWLGMIMCLVGLPFALILQKSRRTAGAAAHSVID